jgi:DNA sulfur modification protein DndD
MPQVFIDTLTVENFGPFYGRSIINFAPVEDRCGILIGGKNGAGKTHLLRALYLAVVGETGVHDLKSLDTGSDATRFLFDRSLNRKALAQGKEVSRLEIELTQRDERGAGAKKMKLVREISHRPSGQRWKSFVVKPDGNTEDDDAAIQRLRDSFLPRHLARFFFFDAERSQGVHLGDKDIVDGISRILGLWTYGELEQDLRNLVQNTIPRTYNNNTLHNEESKLVDLTADVSKLQGHLKAKSEELKDDTEALRDLSNQFSEIDEELRILGAVDPIELDKAKQRREELKTAKDQMEGELRNAWELALPIALLGHFREELHEYLVQEEKRNEWERSRATVEPKIPQVKADVFEDVPNEFTLKSDFYAFYSDRLEKALHRLFHPPPEGMADHVFVAERCDVSAQVRSRLVTGFAGLKSVAELSASVDKMTSEIRELDSKLKYLTQNSAAIVRSGELRERRRNIASQQERLQQEVRNLEADIHQMEAQLAEKKREEENQKQTVEKAQQGRSLATLAATYREAAEEIQKRAAVSLRNKIAEHVGELWVNITGRGREFLGMDFDKHWNCSLVRRDGSKMAWDESNTSAGQKQVRMLAFYEALRRLARLVPPLVVDTPLGRLDKEVRQSVLERLYLTGHQSIMLATNSEIDPEGSLFDRVEKDIARVYTLNPVGKPESPHYEVEVTNDYFGRSL